MWYNYTGWVIHEGCAETVRETGLSTFLIPHFASGGTDEIYSHRGFAFRVENGHQAYARQGGDQKSGAALHIQKNRGLRVSKRLRGGA